VPRPALRSLGSVLLGGALYAYGATSEVSWLFLLAYSTWTITTAAFVYVLWARRGVRAELALAADPGPASPLELLPPAVVRGAPVPPIFEGDGLRLIARLRAEGAERGPVRLRARLGEQPLDAAAGVVGAAGVEVGAALTTARRGVVEAAAQRLRVDDPAGLFWSERRLRDRELGAVLPLFAELNRERRLTEVEDATSSPRAGSGSELFGVREYRPGDPLRRIHWRLSARRATGSLVVREYEPPGLRTLLLVLDPEPSAEAADQAARIAASEAWDCLRAGGRVVLWAAGLQGSGEQADLWALLGWLARWPHLPADDGGPPPAGECVAVTTTGAALDALELARHRGRSARAWTVGMEQAEPETEVPCERAGLEWPLQ
jgi:uncharacterized protein (DUF58 family)